VLHRFVAMSQTEIDAFAHDFEKVMSNMGRDILANNVSTKRQRQFGFLLPPFSKVDNFSETGLHIGQLAFVNN